jgi:rubrerythrin
MSGKSDDEKMQNEATDLLKKQIEVERTLIRLYGKTHESLKSPAVKHLLHSIQLDSIKHIGICETAIEILSGEEIALEEKRQMSQELSRHLELEKDSIKRVKKIVGITLVKENQGVKRLMDGLSDDEKRHHKMLMQLISKPFYRIDPNDWVYMFRGEDIIRQRQQKGSTIGVPKKKI